MQAFPNKKKVPSDFLFALFDVASREFEWPAGRGCLTHTHKFINVQPLKMHTIAGRCCLTGSTVNERIVSASGQRICSVVLLQMPGGAKMQNINTFIMGVQQITAKEEELNPCMFPCPMS